MANLTYQQVSALLRAKGFSKSAIERMRIAMINDAVQNAHDIHSDRIFTLIALMLKECYGFGQVRIFRGLKKFDELCDSVLNAKEWPEIMQELRDKTGIVISTNSDDRLVFEYLPER